MVSASLYIKMPRLPCLLPTELARTLHMWSRKRLCISYAIHVCSYSSFYGIVPPVHAGDLKRAAWRLHNKSQPSTIHMMIQL